MKAVVVTNRIKRYLIGFRSMIEPLKELGYEVTWAGDFKAFRDDLSSIPCNVYQVDFRSNPFDPKNIRAYFQLLKLLRKEKFDVMHCNTPIGALIGRLCAKQMGIRKVIYTAHGFHFYKGAPLFNRTLIKWSEKYLGRFTDVLITINTEDYKAAQDFILRDHGKVYHVHGVGIETMHKNRDSSDYLSCNYLHEREINKDFKQKREEIGVPLSASLILSVGELNRNKNNQSIIKAIANVTRHDIYYVLCGEGKKRKKLEKLAKDLKVDQRVIFLGYRTDISEILAVTDIFALPSYREGLSRSLMEAMAAGLPCIVSKIRGNVDLIKESRGGFLLRPKDIDGFAEAISAISTDEALRQDMGAFNLEFIIQFDIENVKKEMKDVYAVHT